MQASIVNPRAFSARVHQSSSEALHRPWLHDHQRVSVGPDSSVAPDGDMHISFRKLVSMDAVRLSRIDWRVTIAQVTSSRLVSGST